MGDRPGQAFIGAEFRAPDRVDQLGAGEDPARFPGQHAQHRHDLGLDAGLALGSGNEVARRRDQPVSQAKRRGEQGRIHVGGDAFWRCAKLSPKPLRAASAKLLFWLWFA